MDKTQNKDLNSNLFSLNKNQIKEEKKRKQEEELRKAVTYSHHLQKWGLLAR